jgi:hypothetical protein
LKELYKETHLLENFITINLQLIDKLVDGYEKILSTDIVNLEESLKFKEYMKISNLSSFHDTIKELKPKMQKLFEEHFTIKYNSSTSIVLENHVASVIFSDFQVNIFKLIIACLFILIGICCVISYYYNIDMDSDAEFKFIFPMFRAYFCVCLYFWVVGINVFIWNKIFQFTNQNFDVISICVKAAFFSSLFVVMYLFYMIIRTNIPIFARMLYFLSFEVTPLICWIVLLIYTLCPLRDYFDYQERLTSLTIGIICSSYFWNLSLLF